MTKKTYTRLFRQQFVETWFATSGETTFIQHCERFGVSRQAGYEWVQKFHDEGMDGLETKSSAPGACPHETDAEIVDQLIAARRAHPTWGPRKLKAWLEQGTPWDLELPAPSTIGDILKRAGLVPTRRRRSRTVRHSLPFREVQAPNDVWTTDFKGQFRTRDGRLCYPLTLVDCFSRYLLRCDAYPSANAAARASFEAAFIEYGMPTAIRSDNGVPFAIPAAPAGLSPLSVWWIRLGITPERIAPASPWQNGRHERMHRTLKTEATQPPQANRKQQQRTFDAFRAEFNGIRPHEALGQKPPRAAYNRSKRRYPKRLPELEYGDEFQIRRVSDAGLISWEGHRLFLSNVLRGELVGLKQTKVTVSELYFGPVLLGTLDSSKPERGLVRGA
jgi:putative transposase